MFYGKKDRTSISTNIFWSKIQSQSKITKKGIEKSSTFGIELHGNGKFGSWALATFGNDTTCTTKIHQIYEPRHFSLLRALGKLLTQFEPCILKLVPLKNVTQM